MLNLTSRQLRRAADVKDKIESLTKELTRLLGTNETPAPRKRRRMSAAGRARISAASKARWAAVNEKKASGKPVKKAKRKMSAANKAKLSARMKALWKARKAAQKK
jgi:hypothetical protein